MWVICYRSRILKKTTPRPGLNRPNRPAFRRRVGEVMKINPAPTLAQLQQKTASSEPPPPSQTSKTVTPPNNRKRVVRRKKIRKIPRPSSEPTTNTSTRPVAQRRVQVCNVLKINLNTIKVLGTCRRLSFYHPLLEASKSMYCRDKN